jgi:DNA-binding transcriptional regulator YiaG
MSGEELRRHRRRLGLTQVQLAAELDVHPITLSRWERDVVQIPEAIARLMRLLKPSRSSKRRNR